jgi:anti-sigma B factor antagonist
MPDLQSSARILRGNVMMKISARRVDQATIFDLSGDVDMSNSPELRKALLHEIRDVRASRVIVNLTGVKYMDSSGVASLVEALKASREVGSSLVLFGLSTSTREVLQLSRLLKVFEVRDNEEQALAS